MSDLIWTTKEGTKLKVKDMDTGHIVNCIKMMDQAEGFETAVGYTVDISDGPDIYWEAYEDTAIYKAMKHELLLRVAGRV